MKKFNLPCSGLLCKVMLLFALLTSSTAMAQNLEAITLETEYTIGMFESPRYTFTAPETGTLFMYSTTQDFPLLWKDGTFTQMANIELNTYNNPRWSYDVVAGTTYYIGFGLGFAMNETKFHLTMQGPSNVETLSVIPAQGSVITMGDAIGISFSVPISISTAVLQGGTSDPINLGININGPNASFEVKDVLYSWMKSGELKEGDEVKLTLTNVHSNSDPNLKAGEDGTLVLTWKACPYPVTLVKATLPTKIAAKWEKGDPAGIAEFVFSGDLSQGVGASLTNGDLSKNGTYERLNATVDGNKVIVDMTGVIRYPATDDPYILDLYNVKDTQGYPVYSPGVGTVGSYSFSIEFDYEPYIEPVIFDYEPADQTNILGYDAIQIYVLNVTSSFKYTGALVNYTEKGVQKSVEIDKAGIKEFNNGTELELTINLPAELQNADLGSLVRFTLLNGNAALSTVTYVYGEPGEVEEFHIQLVSPADGSKLAKIASDESICLFVTGLPTNADVEIMGTLTDDESGDVVKSCFFFPEEGEGYNYASMMYDDVDLIKGHTYTLVVVANSFPIDEDGFRGAPVEIGKAQFVYYGDGEAFIYSDIELIGVDPDPTTTEITSVDQNVVTVKFSGPVSTLKVVEPIGMGMGTLEYKVAKANEDGSEWTFTIPASTIEKATGSIAINMFAYDAEGHPLWKSALFDPFMFTGVPDAMQAKDETCYSIMYICTVGSPDINVVPADGATVDEITEFVLSFSTGINCSWMSSEPVALYKGDEVIQSWDSMYFDQWENKDKCEMKGENIVAWTVTLDTPVTESGEYSLVIPSRFFNLGSEFSQASCKKQVVNVTVAGSGAPEKFNIALVSPANGSTLEKIAADESICINVTGIPADADIEIQGTITDDNTGDNVKWCYFYPEQGEGYNYATMMYDDVDLYEGHTYTLSIVANSFPIDEDGFRGAPVEIGKAEFTYYGSGKEFIYSSIALIGIDPDPATTEITSVDQNVVTVKFSGPVSTLRVVEPMGMGAGTIEYKVAKANEDGSEWTFIIPASTIANATGSIAINMYAIDAEGHPLWKSDLFDPFMFTGVPDAMQAKDETYYSIMYLCTVGSPDIQVTPADGSTVDQLSEFVLSYATGINYSWMANDPITLYKGEEVIQTWEGSYFDPWENTDKYESRGENIVAWTLTLDEVIKANGEYKLVIPNRFFNLGSEFDQATSKKQEIIVKVSSPDGIETISADELDGPVYNVSGQRVGPNYRGFVIKNGQKLYIK